MEPRDYAARTESLKSEAAKDWEHFSGWGIMGLPFRSGHILGLRRFPATSIGPGYTSLWHRDPAGTWTFYADAQPIVPNDSAQNMGASDTSERDDDNNEQIR